MSAEFEVNGITISAVRWGTRHYWYYKMHNNWMVIGEWEVFKLWSLPDSGELLSKDQFEAILKFIETYERLQ